MNKVYLDNAATTPMLPEVIELMTTSMKTTYGNPSSTHQFGRTAKTAIEKARKNIAKHFNCLPSEIVFTSGGTEGDNYVLKNAVTQLGVQKIISTKIEHHAVLHTLDFLEENCGVEVVYLKTNSHGAIALDALQAELAKTKVKTLVSLMWVNNEIGTILPVQQVANLCKEYDVLFHSDTVQAIGHIAIDLQEIPIDFMVASAHKFHGPKGVGFVFVRKGLAIGALLHGGSQERNLRSSTENVHAILGMEKALELSLLHLDEDRTKVLKLKQYLIDALKNIFPTVAFNGGSDHPEKSSYTILSVRFPFEDDMLVFNLDLLGIAASGGSACQSGANKGSHVLQGILSTEALQKASIRFSFSKLTTQEEIDSLIKQLQAVKLKHA